MHGVTEGERNREDFFIEERERKNNKKDQDSRRWNMTFHLNF